MPEVSLDLSLQQLVERGEPTTASVLTPQLLASLEANYWIGTVGQLLQATLNAGHGATPHEAFGVSREQLEALVDHLVAGLPEETVGALQSPRDFALGALLEDDELEGSLLRFEAPESLPPEACLIHEMSPIVDQGSRGTCVACAATGVHEWDRLRRDEPDTDAVSIQHLYYRCKKRDGSRGPGTYSSIAVDELVKSGQCLASTWPYNPAVIRGNEGHGPPPPGVVAEARDHRVERKHAVEGNDVNRIKAALAGYETAVGSLRGRPLLFGIPLHASFMGAETARTGRVLMPLPGEKQRGGHAMVLVGYRDGSAPGGGYFIIRNSWGEGWGAENEDGPGHAHLPYAYIQQYGRAWAWGFFDADEAELLEGAPVPAAEPRAAVSLGRRHDDGGEVPFDLSTLNRHFVALGTTGSGKTQLCKLLVQRALAAGVPTIAVDPQGDVAAMADLLDIGDVRDKGLDETLWRSLRDTVEPVVFTPSSDAGIPICANPLSSRTVAERAAGPRAMREVELLASILVARLDTLPSSKTERKHYEFAVSRALEHGLASGRLERIEQLQDLITDPPERLRELLEDTVGGRRLEKLRKSFRMLLNSADWYGFGYGVPLDIDVLIGRKHNPSGKTRLSVIYLNTLLDSPQKDHFVSLLAESVVQWMFRNPPQETGLPQFLLFIDELGAFIPNPTLPKPRCKDILVTLFKQGRKYGVSCVGASQSVSDFDYRALGQVNSLCVGALKTDQDVDRVARRLVGSSADLGETLGGLGVGEFFLLTPGASEPVRFQAPLSVCVDRTVSEGELGDLVLDSQRRTFGHWTDTPSPSANPTARAPTPEPPAPAAKPDTPAPAAKKPPPQPPSRRPPKRVAPPPRIEPEPEPMHEPQGAPPKADVLAPVRWLVGKGNALKRLRKATAKASAKVERVEAISLPTWRVVVQFERPGLFGFGKKEESATLYFEAITGKVLDVDKGRLHFEEHVTEAHIDQDDLLADFDLRPTRRADSAVVPVNYRHKEFSKARASSLAARKVALVPDFDAVKILQVEPVLLPVWQGVLLHPSGRRSAGPCIDGLFGVLLEGVGGADLRSLQAGLRRPPE